MNFEWVLLKLVAHQKKLLDISIHCCVLIFTEYPQPCLVRIYSLTEQLYIFLAMIAYKAQNRAECNYICFNLRFMCPDRFPKSDKSRVL